MGRGEVCVHACACTYACLCKVNNNFVGCVKSAKDNTFQRILKKQFKILFAVNQFL